MANNGDRVVDVSSFRHQNIEARNLEEEQIIQMALIHGTYAAVWFESVGYEHGRQWQSLLIRAMLDGVQ